MNGFLICLINSDPSLKSYLKKCLFGEAFTLLGVLSRPLPFLWAFTAPWPYTSMSVIFCIVLYVSLCIYSSTKP